MAKGNPLLGQLRGKAGDLVFSRLKGQQIVKSRNRQPNNPRTNAQMANRALFSGAVQFYSRANQAQFKFAFEGKKQKESDYNAFMRYNAKNGIYLMPEEIYDRTIPCPGDFMMTKGSIMTPETSFIGLVAGGKQIAAYIGQNVNNTVAAISASVKQMYNLNEGDIFTMWLALTGWYDEDEEFTQDSEESPVAWYIAQFFINSSDTRTLEEATAKQALKLTLIQSSDSSKNSYITFVDEAVHTIADNDTIMYGGSCITRVENGAVKASTSYVQMNAAARRWWNTHRTEAYLQQVLAAWNATGTPILKGGVADTGYVPVVPTPGEGAGGSGIGGSGNGGGSGEGSGGSAMTMVSTSPSNTSPTKVLRAKVEFQNVTAALSASNLTATSNNSNVTISDKTFGALSGGKQVATVKLTNNTSSQQTVKVTYKYPGVENLEVTYTLGTEGDENDI